MTKQTEQGAADVVAFEAAARAQGLDLERYGDGYRWGRTHTGWLMWQAALAHARIPSPEGCTYCDGTGDVHGLDGEWRGECTECPAAATAAFKNFHRSLCARFGYTHDEKDWRRDLVSLEEHIAVRAAAPPGYALVPLEPTEAMHVAAVRTIVRCAGNDDFPPRVWRAMLAAAT